MSMVHFTLTQSNLIPELFILGVLHKMVSFLKAFLETKYCRATVNSETKDVFYKQT